MNSDTSANVYMNRASNTPGKQLRVIAALSDSRQTQRVVEYFEGFENYVKVCLE
jgi:hypothetical protein